MTTIENNPAHNAAIARREEEKRQRNAASLTTGFWAGIVLGVIATAALVITYLLNYAH